MREAVYLVDDDPAVRESICDLLDSAGILSSCFSSAEEFLAQWNREMQGCLLLDVRLPGISGIELQSLLIEKPLALPIIIMTAHGDIPMVRKALKSGAVEFLTKPFPDQELLASVQQAFALHRASRELEGAVQCIQQRTQTLSQREMQVLELVTAGLTNKEIGKKLHLSIVTIKLYRGQLMRKMQAESFADLVKMWQTVRPAEPHRYESGSS
jgi:FixJ family two-component response regulator